MMQEEIQTGRVELLSGTWHWRAYRKRRGSTIVFHHRDRPWDWMRGWCEGEWLNSAELGDIAAEPLQRAWEDADGLVWNVTMEMPVTGGGQMDRDVILIFTRPAKEYRVGVEGAMRLGELTHGELARLFQVASN
jgi:hypothetical protein